MRYFQSPFHSHILSLRNLSQHFQSYLRNWRDKTSFLKPRCHFCRRQLDGWTSICSCEKCGFYCHTSCAGPLGQIQHPRHEHPMDLLLSDHELLPCSYRCAKFNLGCTFELDACIAMETLWVEKYYSSMLQEAGDGESLPQSTHEHSLTTFPARISGGGGIFCGGCNMQISEEAYGCSECEFFLHEACAKPPLEIQSHPFHPEHPLRLSYDSTANHYCHACGSSCSIGYRCEECQSIVDLSCAIWTVPCDADERERIGRRSSLDHYMHPHQLSAYHTANQTAILCKICQSCIRSGQFFGCLNCSFFLHESCVQHYLHSEHPLTFARFPREKDHKCSSCSLQVADDLYSYTCQMCDFYSHQACALQTLSYLEEGFSTTIQHSLHEHELKLSTERDKVCGGCYLNIHRTTPAYKCISQECSFKLHRSCSQLPSTLEHPAHSPHPLTLRFRPPNEDIDCRRCYRGIGDTFTFLCRECDYYLHVGCAQAPTLKHPFHEHNLFHFWKIWGKDLECSACRESCNLDLFRCGQCDFTLHYECSQLPPSIKSEHHSEPLVLYESFKEDDSGEYYCDICERRRDPNKWVYLCEFGNYELVAHIECASSSVKLEVIEEDDFIRRKQDIRKREAEIKLAQEQVDAKKASLRPMMAKLESQRAELKELRTEHAKWINMRAIEGDGSIREEVMDTTDGESGDSKGEEDTDSTYGELGTLRAILEELETEQANWLIDFLKTKCNLPTPLFSQ